MNESFQYRLSKSEKNEIAENLIDIVQKNTCINKQTQTFISNWVLTGPEEKRKAFFDVWDIVLKNYLPTTRPLLFRSSKRISKKNKITSFTGRIESAKRMSNGKDILIICDTKESLKFEEEFYKVGNYTHTFYPLVSVLKKAKKSGDSGFSERVLNFIGEDEYIMRFDLNTMNSLKWINMD